MPSSLPKSLPQIASDIEKLSGGGRSVAFVSGNFNVIHPGHLRFLKFAASSGDVLVVGVNRDDAPGVFVPEDLRLDGVKNISLVNYSFLLPDTIERCIDAIKPGVVIKGKEHENLFNVEKAAVEQVSGRLVFSSGEVRFSSMDLLQRELSEINAGTIKKPSSFLRRHNTSNAALLSYITAFPRLRVVVVGDLIIDEYITCDPLGMSQEDPTIVVTPIRNDVFLGGAGIVAAHARGLGADVKYFGIVGKDQTAQRTRELLKEHAVEACLFEDESRVTTLKQRFRSRGKTLLRVSHLDQHAVSKELANLILSKLETELAGADLLVFSDFNYGCLPQYLLSEILALCKRLNVPMAADSQSSSQVGDISRFRDTILITPTEHEARLAIRDQDLGLAALAQALRNKTQTKNIFITLGAEGVLVESAEQPGSEIITDQLPAFNIAPKDVAGAGDCLLISAAMALVCGASGWEAAYLGSVAAACQVGRVGNLPLQSSELLKELMH